MNRVFVDLDGVLADFGAVLTQLNLTGERAKNLPGLYANLKPIPGALEAVRSLIGMGYAVFIATKPPTGVPHAYADKAQWVLTHLPELKRRIIITSDKGLLGDEHDFLVDDRPHKANCVDFKGLLFAFGWDNSTWVEENPVRALCPAGWPQVLDWFRTRGRADWYRNCDSRGFLWQSRRRSIDP